jgi:cytochrome c553
MKLPLFSLALTACMATLVGCETAPPEGDEFALGEYVYTNNCEPCHGSDGSGNPANGAPGISSMPDWYVIAQVEKFRDGYRGGHFDDIAGLRMRPIARTVSPDEIVAVAAHVAAMKPVRLKNHTVEGDVAAGKEAFKLCAACHGANGEGNKATNGPPLTGSDDWYLMQQLVNFKASIRGGNSNDVTGGQMALNAAAMDEQAMRDVVAYINTL